MAVKCSLKQYTGFADGRLNPEIITEAGIFQILDEIPSDPESDSSSIHSKLDEEDIPQT